MIDRIVEAIDALGEQPRPTGARKLTGAEHRYRIRIGDYRVVYTVDDSRHTVKAYGVWHPVGLDAWNIARPALFLIDRTGIVRYSFVASWQFEFVTKDEIMRAIEQNL